MPHRAQIEHIRGLSPPTLATLRRTSGEGSSELRRKFRTRSESSGSMNNPRKFLMLALSALNAQHAPSIDHAAHVHQHAQPSPRQRLRPPVRHAARRVARFWLALVLALSGQEGSPNACRPDDQPEQPAPARRVARPHAAKVHRAQGALQDRRWRRGLPSGHRGRRGGWGGGRLALLPLQAGHGHVRRRGRVRPGLQHLYGHQVRACPRAHARLPWHLSPARTVLCLSR